MRKIFKGLNVMATFLLLTLVSSSYSFAQVEGLRLRVDGLACPFCAYGLEKKLKSLEGIESLNISIKQGTSELKFKENNNVDLAKIKTMVKDAGYTLKSMTITAAGTIHKEENNFIFKIKGNLNKLYIFDEHSQQEVKGDYQGIQLHEEFKKKLEGFLRDKTLIKITGRVHSHPDGSFGLSIKEYSVEESKK